jgi:hypothetical protein
MNHDDHWGPSWTENDVKKYLFIKLVNNVRYFCNQVTIFEIVNFYSFLSNESVFTFEKFYYPGILLLSLGYCSIRKQVLGFLYFFMENKAFLTNFLYLWHFCLHFKVRNVIIFYYFHFSGALKTCTRKTIFVFARYCFDVIRVAIFKAGRN